MPSITIGNVSSNLSVNSFSITIKLFFYRFFINFIILALYENVENKISNDLNLEKCLKDQFYKIANFFDKLYSNLVIIYFPVTKKESS
jgi:hypothetical protein